MKIIWGKEGVLIRMLGITVVARYGRCTALDWTGVDLGWEHIHDLSRLRTTCHGSVVSYRCRYQFHFIYMSWTMWQGVRYILMPQQLAKSGEVVLAVPDGSTEMETEVIRFFHYLDREIHDVLITTSSTQVIELNVPAYSNPVYRST